MPWRHLLSAVTQFDYVIVIDILAIAWLLYRLLLLAKGTRALQIIIGLLVFFGAVFVTDRLNLFGLNWLLRTTFAFGPVALVILFLPELRHALEEFGTPGFWTRSFRVAGQETLGEMVNAVVTAVNTMSVKRVGALVVLERETKLEDVIANGTTINAQASSQLIGTIFHPGSPLHDGAIVIRGNIVAAAGCTLPLTEAPKLDAAVHTRHKAALGMSEESDAVVVVVSEETGTISIAVEGRLVRGFTEDSLRERLRKLLEVTDTAGISGSPLGQVATRVGDAIVQGASHARRRSRRRSKDTSPR
ncbi:MAG: TIGR00159 family protein [Armatimonadetes bacterium]|nr:TIGR00159 family protein [Armatimonadota bacterium]